MPDPIFQTSDPTSTRALPEGGGMPWGKILRRGAEVAGGALAAGLGPAGSMIAKGAGYLAGGLAGKPLFGPETAATVPAPPPVASRTRVVSTSRPAAVRRGGVREEAQKAHDALEDFRSADPAVRAKLAEMKEQVMRLSSTGAGAGALPTIDAASSAEIPISERITGATRGATDDLTRRSFEAASQSWDAYQAALKGLGATDTSTEQEQARLAGEAAGRRYDPLIGEAREAMRQGMAKETVGAGQRGGFMSTQYAGIGAFVPTAGGTFVGMGGELEKAQGAYQQVISNLEVAKQQAIDAARSAAETAIRTGKREDLSRLEEAFRLAQGAYESQVSIMDEHTKNVAAIQAQRAPVTVRPGEALVDPTTGRVTYQAPTPQPKPQTPKYFTDEKGNVTKYDPTTGVTERIGDIGKATAAGAMSTDDVNAIVDGIVNGTIPPDTKGLYRMGAPVKAELSRRGFDLTTATTEWNATQKYVATANSPQQLRLRQAMESVTGSLGNLQALNEEFKRTGFAPLNYAQLKVSAAGVGVQADLASRFIAQTTLIQDELGNLFMGGNSPTDKSLDMARNLLNTNYSVSQLNAVIDELRRNIGYRASAIESIGPVGGGRYVPTGDLGGGEGFGGEELAMGDSGGGFATTW